MATEMKVDAERLILERLNQEYIAAFMNAFKLTVEFLAGRYRSRFLIL